MSSEQKNYTIAGMVTELANPNTTDFDLMPLDQLLETINKEDQQVALAVHEVLPQVEKIVEQVIERFGNGGRILYMGAGTSGRISVMEAAEFPPTFGIAPERVQVLMAGGTSSVFRAQETHEDDAAAARAGVMEWKPTPLDCVIGLATSGKTPFVISGLNTAREHGAFTAFICANPVDASIADVVVSCVTGPEVLTGSTRLKAGTMQKMIMNMISTASMVKLGRTYGNRMCYITTGNLKLHSRSLETVSVCCGVTKEEAAELIAQADGSLAVALVMGLSGKSVQQSREQLELAKGKVRVAVEMLRNMP